jgi:hypothetical protein
MQNDTFNNFVLVVGTAVLLFLEYRKYIDLESGGMYVLDNGAKVTINIYPCK